MTKTNTTLTASKPALSVISNYSDTLNISRNLFLESIGMLVCLDKVQLTNEQLDELLEDFSAKKMPTAKFIENQKQLKAAAKQEILKLWYNFNISKKITFSTVTNASVYLDGDFFFYYCILNLRQYPLDYYIQSNNISVSTIGLNGQDSNCYIYISKSEQINNSNKVSSYFDDICIKLGVEPVDVLKIHYSKIVDLVKVINTF